MKKIYVCSPYSSSGTRETNLERAKYYCKKIIENGDLPLAPHVFYTQMLNDDVEEERQAGLTLGIELLKTCDEIWVFGIPSGGMIKEIHTATELSIKIKYYDRRGI